MNKNTFNITYNKDKVILDFFQYQHQLDNEEFEEFYKQLGYIVENRKLLKHRENIKTLYMWAE